MKLFELDLDRARRTYAEQGWVHIREGVTAEFLAYVTEYVRATVEASSLAGSGLAGAKEQFLFDFPPGFDIEGDLLTPVADLFGLDRAGLTLSERHLKMYDKDADPDPLPHKDRLASTISLGITVRAHPGTRAFLYPNVERSVNPFMGPHLLASLRPEHHPRRVLDPREAIEIRDIPGDVMAFPGSSTWHGRRSAAGVALLYLKFNDFGSDPMREDPRRSDVVVRPPKPDVTDLDDATVALGPLLVSIADRFAPPSWEPVTVAEVWDRGPLQISEVEEQVIRMAGQRVSLGRLVGAIGDRPQVLAAVDRLASEGVLALTTG